MSACVPAAPVEGQLKLLDFELIEQMQESSDRKYRPQAAAEDEASRLAAHSSEKTSNHLTQKLRTALWARRRCRWIASKEGASRGGWKELQGLANHVPLFALSIRSLLD